MASSNGDQSYWPGFVDALSNMVMTLIIIIVLLNVALVYFFYKASKHTSQSVQQAVEAVKVDRDQQVQLLLDDNQKLKEAVEKLEAKLTQAGNRSEKEPPAPDQVPPAIERQELRNRTLSEIKPDVNSYKNYVASEGNDDIVIYYEDDNVELNQNSLEGISNALSKMLAQNPKSRFSISIDIPNSVNYSMSRRIAYYRAITLRNLIIKHRVDPKMIEISLSEANGLAKNPRGVIKRSQ